LFISLTFTNFKIVSHEISLYAPHSYNEHAAASNTRLTTVGRFVPALAVYGHRCGPF